VSLEHKLHKLESNVSTADTVPAQPETPTSPKEEEYSISDKTKEFQLTFLKSQIQPTPPPQERSEISNFDRSSQVIRNKFLSRLAYDRIWLNPQEKPKAH